MLDEDAPKPVEVGLVVLKVPVIDTINEVFEMVFELTLTWNVTVISGIRALVDPEDWTPRYRTGNRSWDDDAAISCCQSFMVRVKGEG